MPIIEFEGLGSELLQGVKAAKDAVAELRVESEKAGGTITKQAKENATALGSFGDVVEATTKNLADMRKASDGGTGSLNKDLKEAKTNAEGLDKSMEATASDIAKATFAANALNKQQAQIKADALKIQQAVASGNLEQSKGAQILNQLGDEYIQNAALISQIAKGAKDVQVSLTDTEKPAVSLRTQLYNAKQALDQIVEASNGKITPELIAAAKTAGDLKRRLDDVNKTVEAFNPGAKFQALTGVLSSLANGTQAVVAGLGLVGVKSDDTAKALLHIQEATAFFQGISGFVTGLADNWKNLKAVILAATLETEANSAATVTNTVVLEGEAAATEVTAVATTGFTTVLKALWATMLANPIIAVVAAVIAIGAALYKLTGNAEDSDAAFKGLVDSMTRVRDMKFGDIDFATSVGDVRQQIKDLTIGEKDYEGQINANKEATDRQVESLKEKAKIARIDAEATAQAAQELKRQGRITQKELDDALNKRKDLNQKAEEFDQQVIIADEKQALEEGKIRKKSTEDAVADANKRQKELVDKRKKLIEDLAKLDEELAKRSAKADVQFADPKGKIELEKQAAFAEVKVLEDKLKALNEALGKGNALTVEQDAELANVRFAIQSDANDKLAALELERSNNRIKLIIDSGAQALATFNAQNEAEAQVLLKSGSTQDEVNAYKLRKQKEFAQKQATEAISLEEKLALSRIDAIKRGSETEFEFDKRIELARIDVKKAAAQRQIDLLAGQTGVEVEILRNGFQKILNELDKERDKLTKEKPKIDIFKLLGINGLTDAQKKDVTDSVNSIMDTISKATTMINAAQIAQVDAQIKATEKIVDDAKSRREQLQAELDKALDDQKNGYANNADAIRAQIEETKKVEADALAEKKRLVAERVKLDKKQAVSDAIVQGSSLITAAAISVAKGAEEKGWVGALIAVAAIAGVIASFFSLRAKIKAAGNEAQYGEGGLLKGPSHNEGGVALMDRRTGRHFATAEGGEFVVRKSSTAKYRELLKAINEDDTAKMQTAAIRDLMHGSGIRMDRDKVTQIVRTKETLIRTEKQVMPTGFDAMRREFRELKEEVRSFKEQEQVRPRTSADGKIVTQPSRTVVKR